MAPNDLVTYPGAAPMSEFIHLNGVFYNGTCGECALEEAQAVIRRVAPSQLDMVAMAHELANAHEASQNGTTTLYALAREAERRGLKILTEWDYSSPFQHDWQATLATNAGRNPVILFITDGQNLKDATTGQADERGLQGHFICVLGDTAAYYIANDGDNPGVYQHFQHYTLSDLASAQVAGVLVLDASVKGTPMSQVPTGWTDDGSKLRAPNNFFCAQGFRDFVLNFPGGWPDWNWPLMNAAGRNPVELANPKDGNGTYQLFRASMLGWTPARGVFLVWLGAELEAVQAQVQQANAGVAALKQQLAAAEAKSASLSELPAAETAAIKADIGGLKAAADALDQLTQLGVPSGN